MLQVVGDESEGVAVVEQLPRVVGVGLGHGFAVQQAPCLLQSEIRPLDVSRIVGFQNQGAVAHLLDPGLGQGRGFQETARPFDAGQVGGDAIGDGEDRPKRNHAHASLLSVRERHSHTSGSGGRRLRQHDDEPLANGGRRTFKSRESD